MQPSLSLLCCVIRLSGAPQLSLPSSHSVSLLHVDHQKFGSIRADVIEQMRFKQRLRVIQTIEDTTKRNVVRTHKYWSWKCRQWSHYV